MTVLSFFLKLENALLNAKMLVVSKLLFNAV